jgi:methylated-DNA-[protein]-cysteine S-methyltransferase
MLSEFVYFNSPIGWLRLVANKNALIKIEFVDEPGKTDTSLEILQKTVQQLSEYFAGTRQHFDVPLEMHGTDFQRAVWQALRQIPFGKTVSYKDIAVAIHNPKAVRAVGQANGRNPVPIIVPCHRVVAANGKLGGFSSGLWRKEWLLKHERAL